MTGYDVALRILIALPVGLVVGSFLTVVIRRVPAEESLVRPRSRCPSCGTPVRALDNIPVASWLMLGGRCRACQSRISPAYPLTELTCGALFVAVALTYQNPWQAILLAPFMALLLAISVIDLRYLRIPNRLVYPALIVSAIYVLVGDLAGAPLSIIGALEGFLAYGLGLLVIALIAPRGMGMGDVKLAGLIGLVLGALGLRFVAVAAGAGILLGGVGAIVALVLGGTRKTRIPFGPFMAAGAGVAVFVGGAVADAYLRLLT
jgi:leader peptidase (prepilin peptidase)/N-methyltransferase